MTTDKSRETLASAAVHLDKARGLLVQVRDGGERGWPEAMENSEVAPSLEYRTYIDVQMLLEDFVEPGLALALEMSRLTDAKVTREWQAERGEAARLAERMTGRLLLGVNGDDYVPRFLAEVRKVVQAAHSLRGRKRLTDEERAIFSKAIRLQAALRGEESLAAYIVEALNAAGGLPALDEGESLQVPIRESLTSLSKGALCFSAMLRGVSDLGLETGLSQEAMTSMTEAAEEFARRMALLEPTEDT